MRRFGFSFLEVGIDFCFRVFVHCRWVNLEVVELIFLSFRKVCKNCGCKFEDHDIEVNKNTHEEIVYNLLNSTDDLSSVEYSSEDDETLEAHPLTKEFRKNKQKPIYSKFEPEILQPYESFEKETEVKIGRYQKKNRRRKSCQAQIDVDGNNNNCYDQVQNACKVQELLN